MSEKENTIILAGKEENNRNADHDGFFKEMLSYPEVRTEFLQKHLSPKILSKINVHDLYIQNSSFIDGYERSESDLVFATKDKGVYVYMLLEHQSTPDPEIAYRFMKYEFSILENFRKEFPGRKLPIVFHVLIYNGKTKYTISTKFWDLFEDPETRKQISDFGHHLIDLQARKDTLENGEFLEFFGQNIATRNKGILDLADEILKNVCYTELDESVDSVLYFTVLGILRYVSINYPQKAEYENLLKKHKKEAIMGSFAQEYIEKGRQEMKAQMGSFAQEYIEKGRQEMKAQMGSFAQECKQQGIQQEQRQIAKNMLSKGTDIRFISEVTGLSLDEIKSLR